MSVRLCVLDTEQSIMGHAITTFCKHWSNVISCAAAKGVGDKPRKKKVGVKGNVGGDGKRTGKED